jgi:hypothetical protein
MAGGWEEVAAAGSWIGTGAGTGGELNKHGEAGRAAAGKYKADEVAAVQANCIWYLVFGRKMHSRGSGMCESCGRTG